MPQFGHVDVRADQDPHQPSLCDSYSLDARDIMLLGYVSLFFYNEHTLLL